MDSSWQKMDTTFPPEVSEGNNVNRLQGHTVNWSHPDFSENPLNLTIKDSKGDPRGMVEIIVATILLAVIILCALLGNLSLVAVLRKNLQLKKQVCNTFTVNLCATDLGSTVLVMCTALSALASDLHYIHPVWCNITCAANYCFIIVSMLTLSFISVERYIAVLQPLHYRSIVTRSRIVLVIAYTWIQGLAFACTPVLLNWVHYDYWEVTCAINWQAEKQKAVYYVIAAFIANFVVPGSIMLISYVKIIREVRNPKWSCLANVINKSRPEEREVSMVTWDMAKKRKVQEIKIVKSLLVVVILFFICMTPFCVTKLLKVLNSDPNFVPGYINLFASYFEYLSSMLNPFIYGILRKDFRQAFKRLVSKSSNETMSNIVQSTTRKNNDPPLELQPSIVQCRN